MLSVQQRLHSVLAFIKLVMTSSKSPIMTAHIIGITIIEKNNCICLSCGKSSVHSKNRLFLKTCTCQKRQHDAVKNQSRKPTTIDAGEINNNDIGDSRFDESDNQQIEVQSLCLSNHLTMNALWNLMANLSTVRLMKNHIKMKIHLTTSILMNNLPFSTKQHMIKAPWNSMANLLTVRRP